MSALFIIPLRRRPGVRRLTAVLLLAAACGGSPTSPPPPPAAFGLSCPAALESSSIGGQPVELTFTPPVPTGGTAPVTITCEPASGASFTAGATNVRCTAADAAGQQTACEFTVTVTSVPQLLQTRFMAFGDSLTAGKLSRTLTLLVDSPAYSYPAQLAHLLEERYTGQPVTVLNEGFAGELAAGSHPRFSDALSADHPGAVLLMHGVNDLNGLLPEGPQAIVNELEELVKESRRAGVATFVGTLPPLGPPSASCPDCVRPYNELLRQMARAKGAVVVDVYAAWDGRTGLMGADGIHPTEEGYAVIAQAFFDAIRRTLEAHPDPAEGP